MMDLFKEYVDLDFKLKSLEAAKEEIRGKIVSQLRAEGEDKKDTLFGTFVIARKINWVYSAAIDKLKEKVKLAELAEQKKGKARSSTTEYLRFNPKKDQENV